MRPAALSLAVFVLAGCVPEEQTRRATPVEHAASDSVSADTVLAAWRFRDSTVAALPHLAPHPSWPGLFAAALESEGSGWSRLAVFALDGDTLAWEAAFEDGAEPTGTGIRSLQWVALPGFSEPLLEVYDQTHQGNGFFYLFALQDRTLVQRARVYAVDRHLGGSLEDGRSYVLDPQAEHRLAADYPEGEPAAVRLQGTVQTLGTDEAAEREEPCTVWLQWDEAGERFVLDPTRLDCAPYRDRLD